MLEKSKYYKIPYTQVSKEEMKEFLGFRRIEKMTGIVKRKAQGKNFGFIRSDAGLEYFFHAGAVVGQLFNELKEGDKIEFEPDSNSPKGPRAELVRKI